MSRNIETKSPQPPNNDQPRASNKKPDKAAEDRKRAAYINSLIEEAKQGSTNTHSN